MPRISNRDHIDTAKRKADKAYEAAMSARKKAEAAAARALSLEEEATRQKEILMFREEREMLAAVGLAAMEYLVGRDCQLNVFRTVLRESVGHLSEAEHILKRFEEEVSSIRQKRIRQAALQISPVPSEQTDAMSSGEASGFSRTEEGALEPEDAEAQHSLLHTLSE